jgi:hypothetical protein
VVQPRRKYKAKRVDAIAVREHAMDICVSNDRKRVHGQTLPHQHKRAAAFPRHSWEARGIIPDPAGTDTISIAIIDGPFDVVALSKVLAQLPLSLAPGSCSVAPNDGCDHGTFIMGVLGARNDAVIPGLCPGCRLLHIPLFMDEAAPSASLADLASAITTAVKAGANLINLSLAVLNDSGPDPSLASALDHAEACGAVILVAAGNQGHQAMGQLLSHPATIPVVAVDAARRLLPDCNFGHTISHRGIAALGHQVLGYAPGGGTTVMSGTSVATAVASGLLAALWSEHPDATAAEILAAVERLGPRGGPIPPMLDGRSFLAALNQTRSSRSASATPMIRHDLGYASLQGGLIMNSEDVRSVSSNHSFKPTANQLTPAHGSEGCACGRQSGFCTCTNSGSSRFIYVLGSVDIRFPDQSISEEFQVAAQTLGIKQNPNKPLRDWYHQVLSQTGARYIARQVCWILKVEGQTAYYLTLHDMHDLPDLISCLGNAEDDLDLFIGSSTLVPVDNCPAVTAPVLFVQQLCSFQQADLIKWFKTRSKAKSKGKNVELVPDEHDPNELFRKLVQSADNFGDTDELRALNYLAVRYQPLYELYAELVASGLTLDSIKVEKSRLWRQNHIVDPVFSFRHRQTGVVQKYFVRVDVSHLYPMITYPIAEYFDRS